MYGLEVISGSYVYVAVAYITMHCMIWPEFNWSALASCVQGVSYLDILTVYQKKTHAYN